jgi:hypothetical protein
MALFGVNAKETGSTFVKPRFLNLSFWLQFTRSQYDGLSPLECSVPSNRPRLSPIKYLFVNSSFSSQNFFVSIQTLQKSCR